MTRSYRNTILPEIELKYFKRPDTNSPDYPRTNYICYDCHLINIPIVGAVRDGYSNNPKYYCEDCAISNYMIEFDFESREAAASWRRRIFDVGYLFYELLIDRYLKENNKTYEALSEKESDILLNLYRDFYNNKVSKNKKEDLESIIEQEDLEKELQKYCKKVKF